MRTPTAEMGAHKNPATMSDCANDGWLSYTNPKFKSQRSCERWVRRHHRTSTSSSGGAKRTTTPPAPHD
jgi:hypothetical protein